ncbi:MAG TPA: 5'-nucleotidase C-terminal domain-containing protein [Bacteroidales bacterium]|nr:5'-nucleotidase C-terminal domain-containing protein [Bacteroidales bacterium]
MVCRGLRSLILFAGILLLFSSCIEENEREIKIVSTTDLHGVIFPYDFADRRPLEASLAGVSSYLKQLRNQNEVILLDNGDNLQGQPTVYYYNFIDTSSSHINSIVMNYLNYDAATVGNHDIEAGHAVYDRLAGEYKFPLLAANAVRISDGKPYFKPYVIINRNGLKIAVLGLITPSVPQWLPPVLYSGIEFTGMVEAARKWMPEILKEKPDIVVGLFHSGYRTPDVSRLKNQVNPVSEDAAGEVAYLVPGFDIIFAGHDHRAVCEKIANIAGDSVLILNAGSRAEFAAEASIPAGYGKQTVKKSTITGRLVEIKNYEPDKEFIREFDKQESAVRKFVDREIGELANSVSTRPAYFGPSSFVDLIHTVQLDITGAEISFAAPLSFDAEIKKGPLTVGDMFKLYRYENMLYKIEMKGNEIDKYLEYSYSGWFNTMTGPSDNLMNFRKDDSGKLIINNGRAWLKIPSYNFDSAAGIEYTVDVSKPSGSRVEIAGLSDGRPFRLNETYTVALNSYRGSGGGGHLTSGAGLKAEDINGRLISSTVRDLRYYMIDYVSARKVVDPVPVTKWKVVPESWVSKARERDFILMFGEKEKQINQ